MPNIIFLLLIASSPFYILGDETESWGSIQSGPSESECRPYIEKALQGASVHDSLNEPRDTNGVGESGSQEEDSTATEASEDVPPDLPQLIDELEEKSGEIESQPEKESGEQEIQTEEIIEGSIEINPPKEDESQEKIEESSNEESIGENKEESQEVINESEEKDNQESILDQEVDENEPELHTEDEAISEGGEDLETETEEQTEVSNESAEETIESEKEIETETVEVFENEIKTEPETNEEGHHESDSKETSQEKLETESEEQNEELTESSAEKQESGEQLNETEKEQTKDESVEEAEIISAEKEIDTEETEPVTEEVSETTEAVDEQESVINDVSIEAAEPEHSNESEPVSQEVVENVSEEVLQEGEDLASDNSIIPDKEESLEISSNEAPVGSPVDSEALPEQSGVPDNEESLENVKADESKSLEKDLDKESSTEVTDEELKSEEETAKQNITTEGEEQTEEATPEEELSMIMEIPENLRSREHMSQILRLSSENEEIEKGLGKIAESTLRELKKLYDAAIKPLEILYKYRDLSNRHFGDPEIFSKPLILFMGPWSGGKSTIINYLLENEYKKTALRTGAEPSPAYFNIVMSGEVEEVLDGTQLAADWTFSGLQKFGQGLLDRLRGLKLNHPLLEKVNIVEIPGILEIRKQVERLFPFNDACQWFIDRADIIFLVYDPSKLDVGPETEAILDQLKGREMQTRIILNKADQVKPEELMRVQGTLIWNISPLMSSTEPPIMYSTSLWSLPYEIGAPTRLLHAQERAFLKDIREAVDKRVENKIAGARRFAVRVRNHAKMVDCYLTTYYNHKSFFGNKKKISDDIIEHPQNYHIYEGLSTLTNISRYDLPDPDVYRDFFRLNPVYEFQQLSSTCTYFRGCPINRLDVAIAYDLPELVGKYKKHVEELVNYSKK
ncbi:uro-adherence factor A [Halyomorpha halys]|uniref:uro-adherence factor A n=1 Tax=Halyomorpha halys TaxID=286706 RepID=UPI0006D4D90E|nr:sarcalumenin [Halyomorpha halys]